jgi:biopolymer transport protein ExbD
MARTDKYKKVDTGKEVDLIPFMNLLAILIPALLISTEYIKIATIGVASPRIGPKSEVVENTDEKPPLNLNIVASSLGFYIASQNTVLPGMEEGKVGPTIEKVQVEVYRANVKGRTKEVSRVWTYKGKKYIYGSKMLTPEEYTEHLNNLKDANGGTLQSSQEMDYDYPALHDKLIEIKKAVTDVKGNDQVIVSADPDVQFTSIIRIMDAARYYATDDDPGKKLDLFPKVVLSAGVT